MKKKIQLRKLKQNIEIKLTNHISTVVVIFAAEYAFVSWCACVLCKNWIFFSLTFLFTIFGFSFYYKFIFFSENSVLFEFQNFSLEYNNKYFPAEK